MMKRPPAQKNCRWSIYIHSAVTVKMSGRLAEGPDVRHLLWSLSTIPAPASTTSCPHGLRKAYGRARHRTKGWPQNISGGSRNNAYRKWKPASPAQPEHHLPPQPHRLHARHHLPPQPHHQQARLHLPPQPHYQQACPAALPRKAICSVRTGHCNSSPSSPATP